MDGSKVLSIVMPGSLMESRSLLEMLLSDSVKGRVGAELRGVTALVLIQSQSQSQNKLVITAQMALNHVKKL